MVKHTQIIRRQIADELFECVDHFVGLAHKVLNSSIPVFNRNSIITNILLIFGYSFNILILLEQVPFSKVPNHCF